MLGTRILFLLASARGLLAAPAWCEGAPDCQAMASSLEDPATVANTQYFTVDGSSTKWKAGNTGYITVQPVTTTISNNPVTTTQTARFVVAPTSIVENGATVDSIDVVLSPSGATDLEGLIGKFCTPKTKAKRDGFSCARPEQDLIDYIVDQIEGNLWATGLQSVSAILSRYVLTSRGLMVATAWVFLNDYIKNGGRFSNKLNFGVDPKKAAEEEAAAAKTTSKKQETTTILMFDDAFATDGPDAYSSMGSKVDAMITEIAKTDTDWYPAPTGPWCVHGGAPNQPKEPKEYCQCSDGKMYPVATSTASPYSACPYTSGQSMPPTVVFSTPTPTSTPLPKDPQVECGKSSGDMKYPSLPYRVAMRQSGIEAALKDFCEKNKDKELNTDGGVSYTYNPWGTDKSIGQGRQNIYLKAQYHSTDRCPATSKLDVDACKKAFSTLNNGCDTNTTIAKRGGAYFLDCVEYNLDGTGGADPYRLHFHQKMEAATGSIEWTMYNSINEVVAGPETVSTDKESGMGGTIKGAPYDIKLSVSDATYKDRTNVEMSYPKDGSIFYTSTWNTGKTDGKTGARSSTYYWCDDVRSAGVDGAWKGLGAGFEREFNCYFAAWRDNDLVLG